MEFKCQRPNPKKSYAEEYPKLAAYLEQHQRGRRREKVPVPQRISQIGDIVLQNRLQIRSREILVPVRKGDGRQAKKWRQELSAERQHLPAELFDLLPTIILNSLPYDWGGEDYAIRGLRARLARFIESDGITENTSLSGGGGKFRMEPEIFDHRKAIDDLIRLTRELEVFTDFDIIGTEGTETLCSVKVPVLKRLKGVLALKRKRESDSPEQKS